MDEFLNHLRGHSAQLDRGIAQTRVGIVTSVDSATYSARITIQPEGTLTGWLPVAASWTGNGWGLACAPSPGDQVVVVWQEGNAEQGIIIGRLWSYNVPPPNAPVGELWLMHQSGSNLKLCNDGTILSQADRWVHSGDLHVSGDVYDSHGALSQLRGHYNVHVHPPSSDPPSPTD